MNEKNEQALAGALSYLIAELDLENIYEYR